MSFPSTHAALARALAARDYSVPTPVQLAVLEADAAACDLLVSAQTGSGKTVAFGLAMAPALLGEAQRFERAAAPLALIVAPTRELAMQVQRELAWLYAHTEARVITCVGGMDVRAEARNLSSGAHIVVGTPGRLRDHLERKRLDLSQLKTVVLDEADEMLDLGFREDLEFILEATPASRQTLLFSATVPREIEALARRYQRDARRIGTSRRDEQHSDITYQAIRVVPGDIENAVVNVLRFHEAHSTLVFRATREAVKRLHARLLERGFAAVALSGELSQSERSHALQALRDGRARVLVATDVAARGLDLPDLALVIHADLPNDGETLLHRSGRTGRAGRKGICTLIVPHNRRRKAETLLETARIKAAWEPAPTADQIRARDQERFLADAVFTEAATPEEAALVGALQAARSADQIALALVRIHGARLPAPEDLAKDMGPPRREERSHAGRDRVERGAPYAAGQERAGPGDSRPVQPRRPRREDGRAMIWFRLNIGRNRNADPRWLVPLICKAGNISKAEIGTISIAERDTQFQILAEIADQFATAVHTAKNKEGHITRVGAETEADEVVAANVIDTAPTPVIPRPAKPPVKVQPEKAPTLVAALPRERQKKPWQPRPHATSGGQPNRPEGKKAFVAHGHKPRGTQTYHGQGAQKAASKYANKKKNRPPAAT